MGYAFLLSVQLAWSRDPHSVTALLPFVSSAPGEVCQPLGPQPLVWAPPTLPTLCGVPLINISPFELRVCLFPPGAAVYTVSTHNLASPSEPQDLIPVSSVEP